MKLKNTIFVNGFVEAFIRLKSQKFSVPVAWRLNKLNDQLVKENEAYEAARQKLLESYGERDKKGDLKTAKATNANGVEIDRIVLKDPDKFDKEFQELLGIEEEYKFDKLKLPEDFEMTAQDVGLLKDILDLK